MTPVAAEQLVSTINTFLIDSSLHQSEIQALSAKIRQVVIDAASTVTTKDTANPVVSGRLGPNSPEPRPTMVYLVGGQVLVGYAAIQPGSLSIVIRHPREILVTPAKDGGAEVSLIPYGHVAGLQMATLNFLVLEKYKYLATATPEGELLANMERANSDSSI